MARRDTQPLLPDENSLRDALTALYQVWREYARRLGELEKRVAELEREVRGKKG